MKRNVLEQAADYNKKRRKKVRRYKVFSVLAAFVVFCTTYSLIMPAITMENPKCGLEEHTHGSGCYAEKLVCSLEESEGSGHSHDDGCYDVSTQRKLTCGQAEGGHSHSDSCYTVETVTRYKTVTEDITETVTVEETETRDLTDEEGNVIGSETVVTGSHEETRVVGTRDVQVEDGSEEVQSLTCGQAEGNHSHDDSCYTEQEVKTLICTESDSGHAHGGSCYERTLACELSEHNHSDACKEEPAKVEDPDASVPEDGDASTPNGSQEEEQPVDIVDTKIPMIDGILGDLVDMINNGLTNEEGYLIDAEGNLVLDENGEPIKIQIPVAADEQIQLTKTSEDYSVTVTYGPEANLPEDVTLEVRELEGEEYDEHYQQALEFLGVDSLWFVRFFDITFLTADDEKIEPNDSVNVSITYDPIDLDEVAAGVIHFAEDGIEELTAQVSETSVDFTQDSFSVTALYGLTIQEETSGGSRTPHHDDISGYLKSKGANDWQIVKNGYEGNDANEKIPDNKIDPRVRLQKNVIPTGNENEFYVYLSIDTNAVFEQFLRYAPLVLKQNEDKGDLGIVKDKIPGAREPLSSFDPIYDSWAEFQIVEKGTNKIIVENARIYWNGGSNCTIYLKVNEGYMLLCHTIAPGTTGHILELPTEAIEKIWEEIVQAANLGIVVDEMGLYIDRNSVEIIGGDYFGGTNYDKSSGKLNWYPAPSDRIDVDDVLNKSQNEIETVWFENIAQLVYKVKLDVTKDGFKSCADTINDKTASTAYKVNEKATLTFDTGTEVGKTAYFPEPYVRGLLYDVEFTKVDANDEAIVLSGAEFTMTGENKSYTGVSDENGLVKISVPWGSYELKETKAPKNHKLPENPVLAEDISLCYTDNTEEVNLVLGTDGHFKWNGTVGVNNKVTNERSTVAITVEKVTPSKVGEEPNTLESAPNSDNWSVLSKATFKIYEASADPETGDPIATLTPDADGGRDKAAYTTGEVLEIGTLYKLIETDAPAGYNKLSTVIYFKVADDGQSLVLCTASGTTDDVDKEYAKIVKAEEETLTLIVANYGGYVLPSTGGEGTLVYTLAGGMLLMACALTVVYKKSLRKEGREF